MDKGKLVSTRQVMDFYQFRRRTLKADSSQFLLNTPDEKAIAIRAVNYNAFVDFDSARAVFNAGRIARIDFGFFLLSTITASFCGI